MTRFTSIAAGAVAALFLSVGTSYADDLVFMLTNNTSGTLERFYTSPVGVNNWEEDVFGDDVLEPGESMKITVADGRRVCKYDMRFEFTEESAFEDMEDTQDLCATGSYTIHQ
ncbi:hypothetical protein [Aliirhizobium smilacinae]|uniref:Argininosuccinate lyase n=1 Tax=Aliirhizobium smilacinae TaxID=1395944 RepID=A0A5C4XP59_9HYPH|nr:hypothetical protein [Rhizobium smilacinae]TNM65009.1 hypothetical protein FHP24_01545 [Rhizobium smilacinae]